MLFYRAAVDLSRSTLNYVAGIIRRHRKAMGSRWRRLNPGQQALLVLVYLRKDETFAEISAGFGVSATTAWRYVEETVMLLSARSPKLAQALRKAARDGLTHVILDGTLIHTDRVRADRPFFSGKHRVHGMNIQVIAGPDGTILWTSGALPGKTHDLTAARVWGILRELEKAGILTLADKGYQGAETTVVITPYKGKNKPDSQKRTNRSHAKLRGPGERANAQLKAWRILRKLRCCPHKAGHLAKAIAVLQNHRATQPA
ncbi:transposase family protein [Nonomuraea sp. NPDC059023]|uniref:transposase family protein n=1 Tax=unclassified Nonomuraea TaxID=2593643 RepID=UPI0036C930C0